MDASVQEALLKDPKVQQAMKDAGAKALSDPKVQEEIVKQCKARFPEYAEQATSQVKAWASDPAVQEKAKQYAGMAMEQFIAMIEQGPTGIRILAFIGGVASCVNAGLSVINPMKLVFGIVMYVIAVYEVLFSLTTMLFEAPPSLIEKVKGLNEYQDLLIDKAKFLTEFVGRGMFYIFMGSLWLAFASFTQLFDLIIGIYLCFIGVIHVLMHFGYKPEHMAQKMRSGYDQVKQKAGGAASSSA